MEYDGAMVSFGGGVNSTAMVIRLANEGWRGPIVFSDTGCEWPDTYCFMDAFEAEWLKPRGLVITRIGAEYREPSFGPSLIEYCEGHNMIPLAAIRWCTFRYKINPLNEWRSEHGFERELIGIAADEAHRQQDKERPLVNWGITRGGCVDIIEAEGLPIPRKSGCYICPFQSVSQWSELWERYPELFERAARLEENVQRKTEGRHRATLDPSGRRTLRDLQLAFESQMTLFDDDTMEDLKAYQPCMCGL